MVIPSDLESKLHNGTIKSSFKSQVFNIPKDGICWTSLYSLFQKCFSSLSEGLFPHNIQSEFVLLLLQIAVTHVCMHTSLLWEEFFFLFPITPIRYKRLQTEASVWGLSDSQLQAKQSCLSFYVYLCKSYICLCISHAPVSYLSWWHSAALSPVSHSQESRTGHCTPGSAPWIPGKSELPFLFVPPTIFLPTKPYQWSAVSPQECVFVSMIRLLSITAHRLLLHC